MTTEALKATAITNADLIPPTKATAGVGATDRLRSIYAFLTTTSGKTIGSTYRLARFKSTVVIRKIILDAAAAAGSSAVDIGAYYSDSTVDGTAAANQGLVVSGAQAFFASAVDISSAVRASDVTNESGSYTIDKRNQPLWQALGLATDPGGYIDIVATSTATITTGGLLGLEVQHVN